MILVDVPAQIVDAPEIEIVAVGKVRTFTFEVVEHPFASVYVIVVFPAETPVNTPVELMVATAVLDDVHAFEAAGVPEPANCDVAPIQVVNVPEIVGNALTVIVALTEHPLLFV